ncbi:MAG: hypothetical protein PHH06_02925 [Candidatus Gracilibacteria bacterium]|nr:hypothetical protein [Candidatus Gracilibacteria bacterium]
MPKYKITVSKDQKKYTIVYEAENERLARDRVHKEGYSILGVEEYKAGEFNGKEYVFEAEREGVIKKGKVVGTDIFKVYLKLRDGLGYNVNKLYIKDDYDLSEYEKEKILKSLKDQYEIFKNIKSNSREKKQEDKIKKDEDKKNINDYNKNFDNFYLKKELEETYKLIDFVLIKLNNIFEKDVIKDINHDKKEKLKNIYNSIIKIRNSTNISKLKEIGEIALIKIGELELELVEKNKSKQSKQLLKDTNKLLKKIGSSKQFVEKEKDIKYILGEIKEVVYVFFKSIKKEKIEQKETTKDEKSYYYLKTLSFLNKYKKKLRENDIEILKNLHCFIFPFGILAEKRDDINIKRSVIKQNIALLNAKVHGKTLSYTKVVKGYSALINTIFSLFVILRVYIFYTVFSYALIFVILLNLNYYQIIPGLNNILNFNGIFYFLVLLFTYFSIYFSRGIFSLILNFVILTFIIIFGVVNF